MTDHVSFFMCCPVSKFNKSGLWYFPMIFGFILALHKIVDELNSFVHEKIIMHFNYDADYFFSFSFLFKKSMVAS